MKTAKRSATLRANRRQRNLLRRRLRVESLEERRLLAGLVSHWTADNIAYDSVGTNHGTLVSGATYATGQDNQAFKLDGVDDRIVIADSESLKLTESMTIESWIKIDSFPSGAPHDWGQILFRGDDRGGLDPYQLRTSPDGAITFQISDATNATASVTASAPLGQFFHVAATLDDATGEMRLYQNGVLVSQAITAIRPFADLDPAHNPGVGIGNHGGYPSTPHNFPFHGLIDELRLYDVALTAEEVLENFNAEKGSLQPSLSVSDTTIVEGDSSVRYLGNFISQSGGLYDPYSLIYGPDGHLYVSTRHNSSILRYDSVTGAPMPAPGKPGAEFVSPGEGGLSQARGIGFGPDGHLYVVSTNTDAILRFDSETGAPVPGLLGDGVFVATGSGGLDAPRGLLFHDGYLYVTSVGDATPAAGMDSILRFNSVTGAPAGVSGLPGDAVFVAMGSGGMDNPSQIVFHDGSFYVSSTSPSTSNSVLRFGTNGSFQGTLVSNGSGGLAGPVDLVFYDGSLYVTSWTNAKVLRYDAVTGAFESEVVSGGGLARPIGLVFESNGNMLVASGNSNEIRRYGSTLDAVFTVSLSVPWTDPVSVSYATADGSATSGSDYIATDGMIMITFAPGETSKTILVPTLDDEVYEGDETFFVNLSHPVGATIADSHGVGTIIDNDLPPTKFYVVDDGSPDRTYEYGETGTPVENYSLNSGNTRPRGAASNLAGDKVWVVDANKKVYIYNDAGGLLGSWTAGSLASNATVEGIATNGTDVWIVDARQDRVYRYADAASRLLDNQSATSSFALNRGNRSPKDIVTDGTHLWVVEDSTTDKVFKYTLSGSLVGSWTINAAGGSPTGITLDPSGASQSLWVVDSASDRVYEYANARAIHSGSLSAPLCDARSQSQSGDWYRQPTRRRRRFLSWLDRQCANSQLSHCGSRTVFRLSIGVGSS